MRRHLRQQRKREVKQAELTKRRVSVSGQYVVCGCGKTIFFANTDLCEDCWVDNQLKYHGNDQSAKIN
jgi:hypothetical protein